jgi:hypothetical protein
MNKLWDCSVFVNDDAEIPNGADFPPREAVISAMEGMGLTVVGCSSGWGSEQSQPKLAKLKSRVMELENDLCIANNKLIGCAGEIAALNEDIYNWITVDGVKDIPVGDWLVYMPRLSGNKVQAASVHKNVTAIGNCLSFDMPKVTMYRPVPDINQILKVK